MSDNHTQRIVNKAWNFAHVLRDDGLSYMEYTEQITFLLFLKMAHERTKLSRKDGMLGEIFRRARQQIQNPATLKRLIVDLIDPEDWSSLAADVKGDIYEGLLARSAQESPRGAGQYFTPRELIRAVVDVMQPGPDDTVCDPACGTGGFLLAAHDHVLREHGSTLDPDQKRHLRRNFVQGVDLVPATARLCIMNLLLHGIDPDPPPVRSGVDSLASDPGDQFSMVLTNPPFGKKSTVRVGNQEGELEREPDTYERQDFWTSTKNKQLNFLQHVKTLLTINGSCAIVVPDNVLFEGGPGKVVRAKLLNGLRFTAQPPAEGGVAPVRLRCLDQASGSIDGTGRERDELVGCLEQLEVALDGGARHLGVAADLRLVVVDRTAGRSCASPAGNRPGCRWRRARGGRVRGTFARSRRTRARARPGRPVRPRGSDSRRRGLPAASRPGSPAGRAIVNGSESGAPDSGCPAWSALQVGARPVPCR